jgi:hypothetical protein
VADIEKKCIIYFLFTYFYLSWKGGRGQCIYFRSFIHIIELLMNIWWQLILIRSQIIIWSYLCDQNWWNIIKKKNRYEFLSAFIDQRLQNMVQRLFADVIHDAIWLMNMHEQWYPWFLAMMSWYVPNESGNVYCMSWHVPNTSRHVYCMLIDILYVQNASRHV